MIILTSNYFLEILKHRYLQCRRRTKDTTYILHDDKKTNFRNIL